MALSKTLVPLPLSLIASFLLLMQLANMVHSQSDTTSFTYDSFAPDSENLTYQGDAFVPSGSTFLRLTATDASGNPERYSVGRVVYSPPVFFWEPGRQATFETTIRFFITPVNSNPADGITFFIAPVNFPIGSNGGSFGLFSASGTATSVFAVEFDTFFGGDNSQWDPSFRHIGININSRTSRNVTRFDDPFRQVVTARINYVSSTRTISVVATYGSRTSTLSYVFDLKTVLPQRVQVGISGSTGSEVELNDLLSWYFTSTLVWDGINVVGGNQKNAEGMYIRQYV